MANRILLADDSITIQKVVNLTFSDEGIDVVTVGNGDLALKKLREEAFDLVLADIFMPGTDGYKLCEYVKAQPELGHVPVILLVGAFEPFDRTEAARVRADGHLTKPFESRILVETVRRMLAAAPSRVSDQVAAAPPQPPVPQASSWNVAPPEEEHAEESEPAPPPYDPYASTAKLPPLQHVIERQQEAPQPPQADQATQMFGSPFAAQPPEPPPARPVARTGDLFHLDVSTPFVIGAEPSPASPPPEPFGTLDVQSHEPSSPGPLTFDMPPVEPPSISFEQPAEPPPPMQFEAPEPPRPVVSPIGYQPASLGESPLDLDDLGAIERHTAPVADVLEVRDPLLDTFQDVKESTVGVDSAVDPGLVPNAQPEGEGALTIQPVDDLVSGWEAPQPTTPEPAWDPNVTQAYSLGAVPFDAAEQITPDAPEPGVPASFDPSTTQVYSPATPPFEAAEPAAPSEEPVAEVTAAETIPAGDYYEMGLAADSAPAEGPEPVAAASPSNGASAHDVTVPRELIDEVVRRTVERMSDDVIREIAWEVVPDLAEALIRKHLSERG